MALVDDLRRYIGAHGFGGIPHTRAQVTILGEMHGHPSSNPVAQEFLHDPGIRFFANESFLNSTVVRRGVRRYLNHRVLPPPDTPGVTGLTKWEKGERWMVRRFAPVIDDLRAHPHYILNIGSTLEIRSGRRDSRLAQHFFEEFHDRGLTDKDRGFALLGAAHAAAVPIFSSFPKTTRMILEEHHFRCCSILLMSGDFRTVQPTDGGDEIDLLNLLPKGRSRLALDLRRPHSPFRSVQFTWCDTGHSVAQQFEFVILGV